MGLFLCVGFVLILTQIVACNDTNDNYRTYRGLNK